MKNKDGNSVCETGRRFPNKYGDKIARIPPIEDGAGDGDKNIPTCLLVGSSPTLYIP